MTDRKREETALFRFGVIFPLLDERRSRGSLRRLVNEICSRQYEIPFSSRRVIRAGTVRTWYYRYLRDRRIETLMPKSRRDVGESRTVDLEAANELLRRHSENPDMPLTTLVRTMAEEGQTVKMHSAYRLVARCGPKVIVEEGGSRRLVTAHCFAFMDDKSRLVTHAQFYLNERTESLLDCMWKAFNRRGLPVRVYTDNGAAMRDFRLKYGLASLEVQLTFATAYHPQSKAKLERFWRTMRMQFLPTLPQEQTLYDLNRALDRWVDEYNNRWHSGIGMSPVERYISDLEAVRPAPADLPPLFRFREERVVSAARTVSFSGRLLEVPLGYGGKRIELRYFSRDGEVEAFFDGRSIGMLRPVDLVHNGTVFRGGGRNGR